MRRASPLLLYGGTFVVVFGLLKVHATYIGDYDVSSSSRAWWALAFGIVLCVGAYAVGLPDLTEGGSRITSAVAATGAGAIITSLAQLALGSAVLPRFVVLLGAVILTNWYAVCASLAEGARGAQARRARVFAIVSEDEAVALREEVRAGARQSATLVGTLTPKAASVGNVLRDAAEAAGATVVVLDRAAQADERIVAEAAELHEAGVRVRTLALFYEEWLGKLPVAELERVSLMFDIGEIHRLHYGRLKRVLDLAAAFAGTAVLIAILPVVLVGNALANRGPLFYHQPRVGKGGAVFDILKFRTMRPGDAASEWTAERDRRVTPFGRWLRRSHLDELPQVLNILRGDLSTVGPRPEQPHYVEELTEKIPFYGFRHLVRPGLTGWAQITYSYGASDLDALEKLQYEFFYLRHQSLSLDLKILARTLRSVVRLTGR